MCLSYYCKLGNERLTNLYVDVDTQPHIVCIPHLIACFISLTIGPGFAGFAIIVVFYLLFSDPSEDNSTLFNYCHVLTAA